MWKLFSVSLAVLFAGTLAACDRQPAEVAQTDASADAAPRSAGTFARPTWAGDHLWEFQRNQPVFNQGEGNDKFVFLTPSDDIAQRPFYVIGWKAGTDGKQSTLFFGGNGHDHVTTAPPKSKGTYKATVQLYVVLPGANATDSDIATTDATNFFTGESIELVYAADVEGDNALEHFTNVETVQKARDQGLVSLMTTFEETVLTMHDIQG